MDNLGKGGWRITIIASNHSPAKNMENFPLSLLVTLYHEMNQNLPSRICTQVIRMDIMCVMSLPFWPPVPHGQPLPQSASPIASNPGQQTPSNLSSCSCTAFETKESLGKIRRSRYLGKSGMISFICQHILLIFLFKIRNIFRPSLLF